MNKKNINRTCRFSKAYSLLLFFLHIACVQVESRNEFAFCCQNKNVEISSTRKMIKDIDQISFVEHEENIE